MGSLRLGKIRAGLAQDLIGLAQFANLAVLSFQLLQQVRAHTRPLTAIDLTAPNPLVQRAPEQPILAAIDTIVFHCEPCSPRCSLTIRTARSRTSGENVCLVRFLSMALSFSGFRASGKPSAVQNELESAFKISSAECAGGFLQ